MEYSKYRETIEKMSDREREMAMLLHLKDIKDLLLSFLEHQGIEPKHY